MATREWIYKIDPAGRPRRFLSHREAAWWAVQRIGVFFLPLFSGPILWALFGPGSPGRWPEALPVVLAIACVWAAVAGTIYVYLALSGGVMGEAERRRYRESGAVGCRTRSAGRE